MSWQRARFKGQEIWAKVNGQGQLDAEGGRVPIRYQPTPGAKIYRASEGRLELVEGAPIESLDHGISADEVRKAPKKETTAGTPGGFGKAGQRTAAQAAMAVEAARELVEKTEGEGIICFTDGACRGNPGTAGAGAVVLLPSGQRGEASQSLGRATNNIAELTAIGLALKLLDAQAIELTAPGILLTDSAYSHGVLSRGWKAKANQALVAELKAKLAERPNLKLHWIAGHVGIDGNERADALANLGVDGVSNSQWS